MRFYDTEVARYDDTRGGEARAQAAAAAVSALLPPQAGRVIDIGGGTGIVSRRIDRPGRTVMVVDASLPMLRVAATRLTGQAVQGDAAKLPLANGCVDAVVSVWLLHLLGADQVEAVIGEVGRILRPGGTFITTVDKNAAHDDSSDLAAALRPLRLRTESHAAPTDRVARVVELAARAGLTATGEAEFRGIGQGHTPEFMSAVLDDWYPKAKPDLIAQTRTNLRGLPNQQTSRPDPAYRLRAFTKE